MCPRLLPLVLNTFLSLEINQFRNRFYQTSSFHLKVKTFHNKVLNNNSIKNYIQSRHYSKILILLCCKKKNFQFFIVPESI